MCTRVKHWYKSIVILQGCRVVQGYRCTASVQGYRSNTGVQLHRSVTGVQGYRCSTRYRCTGEVQLCNECRRSTENQGSRSNTGVVQAYSFSTVLVV